MVRAGAWAATPAGAPRSGAVGGWDSPAIMVRNAQLAVKLLEAANPASGCKNLDTASWVDDHRKRG